MPKEWAFHATTPDAAAVIHWLETIADQAKAHADEPRQIDGELRRWENDGGTQPGHRHDYLSTACYHGDHAYCAAPIVNRDGSWNVIGPSYTTPKDAPKRAARCKFCDAPCRCSCHRRAQGLVGGAPGFNP